MEAMELDDDTVPSAADSGITMFRDGALTTAGQAEQRTATQPTASPHTTATRISQDGTALQDSSMDVETDHGTRPKWKASVPYRAARGGHCGTCNGAFGQGELRLQRLQQRGRACYNHPKCVDAASLDPACVEGLQQLPPHHAEQLRQLYLGRTLVASPTGLAAAPTEAEAEERDLHNLAWWDTIEYTELLEAPTTTWERVPEQMLTAYTDAKALVVQRLAAVPLLQACGPEAARLWKLLTVLDKALLAADSRRPRPGKQNLDGSSPTIPHSTVLAGRLRLFWQGAWAEFVAPLMETPARSRPTDTLEKRAERIEHLAAEGEHGKALAAAMSQAAWAGASEQADEIQNLFGKPSQTHQTPAPPPPDASHPLLDPQTEQRQQLDKEVRRSLHRYQRLKQPGLDASRSEHWEPLKHAPTAEGALVEVVARSLLGHLPAEALNAQMSGSLAAKQKPGGGTGLRVYVSGCAIRRMGAGALVRANAKAAKQAAGPTQYAIAQAGGCEIVHKAEQTWLRSDKSHAVLGLDAKNAFLTMPRKLMLLRVATRCPTLAATAHQWYTRRAQHLWRDEHGRPHWIQAAEGVDPGCGLGAALFAIGTAEMNEELLTMTRQATPTAAVMAILDDVHVMVPTAMVDTVRVIAERIWQANGMELHRDKTAAYTEGHPPVGSRTRFAPTFRCMGLTHKLLQTAEEEGSLPEGASGTPLEPATAALPDPIVAGLMRLDQNLKLLGATGVLRKETQLTLVRTYVVSVPVHRLRGMWAPVAAQELDAKAKVILERLLERPLTADQWSQALLPAKQGGLGLLSAESRAGPAFLSSWASAAKEVAKALGLDSAERFRVAAAGAIQECEAANVHHEGRGGTRSRRTWEDWLASPSPKGLQKHLHSQQKEQSHSELLEQAPTEDQADIRSAGGLGQSWAVSQDELSPPITEQAWAAVVRRRLRVLWPSGYGDGTCHHRRADGTLCGKALDSKGLHALTCNCGGGVDRRHNRIRDEIASWLKEQGHEAVRTEQWVPQWQRTLPNGTVEDARLDVTFRHDGLQLYADIVVCSPVSTDASRTRRNAATDGAAAEAAEKGKRRRYPHPELTPLAVETLGRLGAVAAAFARRWATREPGKRTSAIASFYRRVAAALQQHNGDMLTAATAV